jgi:hypothetical protein
MIVKELLSCLVKWYAFEVALDIDMLKDAIVDPAKARLSSWPLKSMA